MPDWLILTGLCVAVCIGWRYGVIAYARYFLNDRPDPDDPEGAENDGCMGNGTGG